MIMIEWNRKFKIQFVVWIQQGHNWHFWYKSFWKRQRQTFQNFVKVWCRRNSIFIKEFITDLRLWQTIIKSCIWDTNEKSKYPLSCYNHISHSQRRQGLLCIRYAKIHKSLETLLCYCPNLNIIKYYLHL